MLNIKEVQTFISVQLHMSMGKRNANLPCLPMTDIFFSNLLFYIVICSVVEHSLVREQQFLSPFLLVRH
eukprot:m.30259 g.30259  ORF g.30259 m.30259 type:complete len:69 (+) comp8188_c1_seq2:1730-1936(+)